MLQKLIKLTSLSLFFLLLIPYQALAEESPENKGELEWKIDRIIQNETGDNRKNTQTELEKSFPNLFREETTSVIETKQEEKSEVIEDLEASLFTMDSGGNTTIKELENTLFTSDYTAPPILPDKEDGEQQGHSWFNNTLIAGLSGFVCVVFGGIYIMMRELSD